MTASALAPPETVQNGDRFPVLDTLLFGTLEEGPSLAVAKHAVAVALGSMCHELTTPLANVQMDALTLRKALASRDDEKLLTTVQHIFQQAAAANALVWLLLASLTDPTTAAATFIKYSMADIVAQVMEEHSFATDKDQVPVSWRPEGDFIFLGSGLLMRHVLANLLRNACQAVARIGRGTVDIRLIPGDAVNHVIVQDTGCGIPAMLLPHLFEPFRSGPAGRGGGLGLAFCHRVITTFGGTITCRSEEGRFTEFDIALPAVADGGDPLAVVPPGTVTPTGKDIRHGQA